MLYNIELVRKLRSERMNTSSLTIGFYNNVCKLFIVLSKMQKMCDGFLMYITERLCKFHYTAMYCLCVVVKSDVLCGCTDTVFFRPVMVNC